MPFQFGSYPSLVIRDGAIAYWRLGETSGLTAVDIIGGFNGTISGGVTLGQPGVLADGDKAMAFDGTNGGIQAPTGAYQTFGTGSATLECWIRPDTITQNTCLLDTKRRNEALAGLSLLTGGYNLFFWVRDTTGTGDFQAVWDVRVGRIPDGKWHHVIGVLTRGAPDRLILYVDGVQMHAVNLATSGLSYSSTAGTGIAQGAGTATYYFPGGIDECAIYPTALTPAQIAAHYAARNYLPHPVKQIMLGARQALISNEAYALPTYLKQLSWQSPTGSTLLVSADGINFSPAGTSTANEVKLSNILSPFIATDSSDTIVMAK
jgi:hypothetical protein